MSTRHKGTNGQTHQSKQRYRCTEEGECRARIRKVIVWQRMDELAHEVYRAKRSFPRNELFGMTGQLRRACLSVATNVVEGYGRQNHRELRQFVNVALGSLAETEYLLDFSLKLGYPNEEAHRFLQGLREDVGRLLWKFYKSLQMTPYALVFPRVVLPCTCAL